MLDQVIHDHIDKQDLLEEEISKEIDKLIKGISIDEMIENPEQSFLNVISQVLDLVKEKYADKAAENGFDFAEKIEDMRRKIKVPESNDPQLNEGLFDGTQRQD